MVNCFAGAYVFRFEYLGPIFILIWIYLKPMPRLTKMTKMTKTTKTTKTSKKTPSTQYHTRKGSNKHTLRRRRQQMTSLKMIPPEKGYPGWRTWRNVFYDLYASKHPVHLLEIGCYQGEATAWFLRNLCHHPKSRVYAVDTFQGSPEYIHTDFNKIEEQFWKNIRATGRASQVDVRKLNSYDALVTMNNTHKTPFLDGVFVDASHEAPDVLSDGFLSFSLLKVGGIMVFDDYEWDKLVQTYYQPKLAIDAFLEMMKPQIEVLVKKRQVIVKKRHSIDVPISQEALQRRLQTFYQMFSKDTVVCLRPRSSTTPIRTIQWGEYRLSNKTQQNTPDSSTAFPYIIPNALVTSVRNVFADVNVQSHYTSLNTQLSTNRSVQLFKQIGLKFWYRSYFHQYMKLLNHWELEQKASPTRQSPNVLNFRYARDFCGRFWSDKVATNYTLPANAFRTKPHFFYDVSCTTDYETYQNTNLDTVQTQRRHFNFISSQLNLWSVENWLTVMQHLNKQVDIMIVSCSISSHKMHPQPEQHVLPETLRHYLRNIHTFMVCAFTLLAQRDGGVACITLQENTLHTPYMQRILFLLNHSYREVQIVYSHYNGVARKIQLFCYHFQSSKCTPSVRAQLVERMKQQAPYFKPYTPQTAHYFSSLPYYGLKNRLSTKIISSLNALHCTISKCEQQWKQYQKYMEELFERLPTFSNVELYNILSTYQTGIYLKWCHNQYEHYLKLVH